MRLRILWPLALLCAALLLPPPAQAQQGVECDPKLETSCPNGARCEVPLWNFLFGGGGRCSIGRLCNADSECRAGEACIASRCSFRSCVADSDCSADTRCTGGACRHQTRPASSPAAPAQ